MDSISNPQPIIQVIIVEPKSLPSNDTNNTQTNNPINIYEHFTNTILSKFHGGYFRICFSLSAQALLWKTLIQFIKNNHYHHHDEYFPYDHHPQHYFNLHILPSLACTLLWSISLGILLSFSILYALKCFYHYPKVKDEFLHHVGVNYLFAPWISSLILLQTSPFILPWKNNNIYTHILFWVFVIPIIILDIKIYGQYFTKGQRFLSRVANPTCQLSIIANLVASKVGIELGWFEIGLCLFSLAMVHYLVLFITLYQRFPCSDGVSMRLRPVFFLFIATPSMASLVMASINGGFGEGSKMLFFLSIFLFMSLICRPTLFKKSMRKFNIAWWAYSFPLTILALASIDYAQQLDNGLAQTLALVLSTLSILVTLALIVLTTFKINTLFLRTQTTDTFTS
ncbi:unnamed protein product [Amaranthus hypochondriacus]